MPRRSLKAMTPVATWLLAWIDGAGLDRVQEHLGVGGTRRGVHPGHQSLGAVRDLLAPLPSGCLKRDAVAVQLVRARVEHAVELEHGDPVLQLEAAGQHGQPLLDLRLGFLAISARSPTFDFFSIFSASASSCRSA